MGGWVDSHQTSRKWLNLLVIIMCTFLTHHNCDSALWNILFVRKSDFWIFIIPFTHQCLASSAAWGGLTVAESLWTAASATVKCLSKCRSESVSCSCLSLSLLQLHVCDCLTAIGSLTRCCWSLPLRLLWHRPVTRRRFSPLLRYCIKKQTHESPCGVNFL